MFRGELVILAGPMLLVELTRGAVTFKGTFHLILAAIIGALIGIGEKVLERDLIKYESERGRG